jgi:hypothetical protein
MTSAGGFAPWAGLVIGLIAWFTNQQAGVSLVPWRCSLGHPTPLLLLGLATLASAGVGLLLSWRALNSAGEDGAVSDASRRFVSSLSIGLAGLFMLTILAQMLAALLLTGCER